MSRGFGTFLAACFVMFLLTASPSTHRYLGMALIFSFAALVVLRPQPKPRRRAAKPSRETGSFDS